MENAQLLQELAPIQAEMSKAELQTNTLVITTASQMVVATNILGQTKTFRKLVTEKKESFTKPLNEALRNIRTFFAPVEAQCDAVEAVIKRKMIAYQNEELEKAAKKAISIEKKVESGKMSFEDAANKLDAITPQKTVEAVAGAVQFRKVKEVIIEDESLLPREYLIADAVKIRKVALAGVSIPGVKVVETQQVAGLSR